MTVPTALEEKSAGLLGLTWRRLPVILRALLAGIAVAIAGIQVWRLLLSANSTHMTQIPWAAVAMAVYLWFYWRYLNGSGWPQSSSDTRRRGLRANSLTPQVWRWALVAGGSFMAATAALRLMLRRFFPIVHTLPDFLQRLSPFTLVSFIVMTSVVAGVVEEAAFRGYLQGPIERRHGPGIAITLTTVVFVLVHLPGRSAISPAELVSIALASISYGILANLTSSILPGLTLHMSGNTAAFLIAWWFDVTLGPRHWHPVTLRAALGDRLFLVNGLEVILLGVVSAWGFHRLAVQARAESKDR